MTSLALNGVSIGALKNITLELTPGQIVCLSGASGSGKSRLLRAIADLDRHQGEIRLGKQAQNTVPGHRWRRMVILVPAETAWWFDTVGEHLAHPMPDALVASGFDPEVVHWPVHRLSSGEKQRLALVRALSRNPQALLLDEPTANLDDATTHQVEDWLLSEVRTHQLRVLWVAHQLDQIKRVGRYHFEIDGSQLVERSIPT